MDCDYCGRDADEWRSFPIHYKRRDKPTGSVRMCTGHIDGVPSMSLTQFRYDQSTESVVAAEITRVSEYPYGEWIRPDEFFGWVESAAELVEKTLRTPEPSGFGKLGGEE